MTDRSKIDKPIILEETQIKQKSPEQAHIKQKALKKTHIEQEAFEKAQEPEKL